MKYKIYKLTETKVPDEYDGVLIGVEFGEDIYDAVPSIHRAIRAELSEDQQYTRCKINVFSPQRIHSEDGQQRYEIDARAMPLYQAPQNMVLQFGIIEEAVSA